MKGRTTSDLFEEVINIRKIHEVIGCTPNAAQKLRVNFKAGKVTEDKMREVLEAAGYQVVQERLWAETTQKAVMNVITAAMEREQYLIESSQPKHPSSPLERG